jgi:hypothetical protein
MMASLDSTVKEAAAAFVEAAIAAVEQKLGFRADMSLRSELNVKVHSVAMEELIRAAVESKREGGST